MQFGCLPQKIDLRDYKVCSDNAQIEYPEEFVLSNLPQVKSQDEINSCCPHATSSILEYHDKNRNTLSTNFIYGIQKKLFNQCEKGMYLAQACSIVKDYGDMLETDCPGNSEVPLCYAVAEAAFNNSCARERAIQFRAMSYYACQSSNDIKYALMNYGPVLAAVYWTEKYTLDNNIVHFSSFSMGGGHAVMCYGWTKDGWLIQNSWGKDFGNNGRCIIPFDYGFMEARVLIDAPDNSDIVLMKPNNNKIKNIFYKIANFILNTFEKLKLR